MKLFSLIFMAVLLASHANEEKVSETMKNSSSDVSSNPVNYVLKKFLEDIKGVIKNGNKFLGIPPLDPYVTGPVNQSIKSEDIRANMTALSIGISGLSNYKVIRAEIKGLSTIGIGFEWPELKGNISSYDIIDGRVMDFVNISGHGNAVYKFKNLNFTADIFLQFRNKTASVKKMISEVSLGGLEFYTDGLYNDKIISEKMCIVISEIGPEAVKTDQKELTDAINNRVIDMVNKFLRKFTIDELIDSTTDKFTGIKQTIQKEYASVRHTLSSIIS